MDNKLPTGVKINGDWLQIWFSFEGSRCWENLPLSATATGIKKAGQLRKKIVGEIKHGTFSYHYHFPNSARGVSSSMPVFFDMAQTYLDTLRNVTKNSKNDYRKALTRTWIPVLGEMPMDKIKYSDLLTCTERLNNLSPKYYNNEFVSLKGVFALAVKDKVLGRAENPADELMPRKKIKKDPEPFSIEEADQILDHIYENFGMVYGAYFQFAFYTGVRCPSEAIALTWDSIDNKKKQARISETRVAGEHQGHTKTYKVRYVDLDSRSWESIEQMKSVKRLHGNEVFFNPDTGEPFLTGKALNKVWKLTLGSLDMPYRRAYNTRHSFASWGISDGLKPAYLATSLGHSLDIFFSTYSTWLQEEDTQSEREKREEKIRERDQKRGKTVVKPSRTLVSH